MSDRQNRPPDNNQVKQTAASKLKAGNNLSIGNIVQNIISFIKITINIGNKNTEDCPPKLSSNNKPRFYIPDSKIKKFVGRSEFLDDEKPGKLDKTLKKNCQTAATFIHGIGGVGKTELCIQYAQKYKNEYPGGICWIDLPDENTADKIGKYIVGKAKDDYQLFPSSDGLSQQVEYCWKNWPGEEDVLVVVDNITDYECIKDHLEIPIKEARFKVLVNALEPENPGNATSLEFYNVPVNPLDEAAALELLRLQIGEDRIEEIDEAKKICKFLGYLPLALMLIGRLVEEYDLSLEKTYQYLLKKDEEDVVDNLNKVNKVLSLSWKKLKENERDLGSLFGLFAQAPIDFNLMKSLLENLKKKVSSFENYTRKDLKRLGLIYYYEESDERTKHGCTDTDKETYQLHTIIQLFIENELNNSEKDKVSDAKKYFCQLMMQEARKISATPTQEDKKAVELSIPHIQKVADNLQDYQDDLESSEIIEIYLGLGRFDEGNGIYDKAEEWYKKYQEMVDNNTLEKESPSFVKAQNALAHINLLRDNYSEAEKLYREAYEVGTKWLNKKNSNFPTKVPSEDLRSVLQSQDGWGYLLCYPNQDSDEEATENEKGKNRLDEAKKLLEEALKKRQSYLEDVKCDIETSKDFNLDIATNYNHLGYLFKTRTNWTKADNVYEKALKIRQDNLPEEHPLLAVSFHNIGICNFEKFFYYKDKEGIEKALLYRNKSVEFLNNALEIYKKLYGDKHYNVALVSFEFAKIHQNLGDVDQAESLLNKVLEIVDLIKQASLKEKALCQLAYLYLSKKDYKEVRSYCDRLLVLAENQDTQLSGDTYFSPHQPQTPENIRNSVSISLSKKDYKKARSYCDRLLDLAENQT